MLKTNISKLGNPKVIMIGTGLDGKGGIASVIREYLSSGLFRKLKIEYYPSHFDGTKYFKFLIYLKQLVVILKKIPSFSIVHLHTASFWSFRRKFIIILISKWFKKKIVVHIHGAMFLEYYHKSNFFERGIIRAAFKMSDKVICLSPQWSHGLSVFVPQQKIVIIPNCVTLPEFNLFDNIKKRKKIKNILFLGKLGERKGVYDLLTAVSALKDKGLKFNVLLCGDGEIEKVKKKIVDLNLQKFVCQLGWVDGNEKLELLKNGYLYVLPSYYEGLPVSILEAMSFGLPVISTNVGGIPFAVDNGTEGFLLEPGDTSNLASKIKNILENEIFWETMSIAARKKIQNDFSIEKLERMLSSLYLQMMATKT